MTPIAEPPKREKSESTPTREEHPSGAEAPTHFVGSIGPAKAVPLLQNGFDTRFSAAWKVEIPDSLDARSRSRAGTGLYRFSR